MSLLIIIVCLEVNRSQSVLVVSVTRDDVTQSSLFYYSQYARLNLSLLFVSMETAIKLSD